MFIEEGISDGAEVSKGQLFAHEPEQKHQNSFEL